MPRDQVAVITAATLMKFCRAKIFYSLSRIAAMSNAVKRIIRKRSLRHVL